MSQQVKVYRKLSIGTSARPIAIASSPIGTPTASLPVIESYLTTDSTSGSVSVQGLMMKTTMTGTGGVGGRAMFHTYTNVTLGTWSNALKAYYENGAAGKSTGLASAFCAELKTANVDLGSAGTYFPLEVEYVAGGTTTATKGVPAGNHVGFIYMGQSADSNGDFDDNGFLMHINGMTAGSGHLFDSDANLTNAQIDHSLRICIDATRYYIPLMDNANGS